MHYTHITDIECPMCNLEIRVEGKVTSYRGDRETPPDYEVTEVSVSTCPDCGADVEQIAFDAVADTDEGPDEQDGPDEFPEPDEWEPLDI